MGFNRQIDRAKEKSAEKVMNEIDDKTGKILWTIAEQMTPALNELAKPFTQHLGGIEMFTTQDTYNKLCQARLEWMIEESKKQGKRIIVKGR